MNLWLKLRDHWTELGCKIPPGVTPQQIKQFETLHRVTLPADLKEYFLTMDGNGGTSQDMFEFLSLNKLKLVHDAWNNSTDFPDCFIFADYCISCWAYAIRLTLHAETNNPVFNLEAKSKTPIANSFSDFMELYLESEMPEAIGF